MERIVKQNSKSHKTNRSKRQPRKGALGQKPSQGFSQGSHTRDRFPQFPRQIQFSSQWTQTIEVDLGGTQYNRALGLFDLLRNIPSYVPEMFNLYRYCRIASVDVTLKVSGESDEANQNFSYEAAMARIPYDQSLSITPQELRHVRGSKYSLRSISGFNCTTLVGHYGSFDELGNPVLDRQFWMTQTEAFNPTPPEPDRPVIAVAVRTVNGNRGIVSINLTAMYHLQFFDLQFVRIPAVLSPVEESVQEIEDSQLDTPKAEVVRGTISSVSKMFLQSHTSNRPDNTVVSRVKK